MDTESARPRSPGGSGDAASSCHPDLTFHPCPPGYLDGVEVHAAGDRRPGIVPAVPLNAETAFPTLPDFSPDQGIQMHLRPPREAREFEGTAHRHRRIKGIREDTN